MRDARFSYIACLPEFSEIEVIIERLDANCCEEDDTESDSKSLLDNTGYIEDEYHDDKTHHEPYTSGLCVAEILEFL